MTKLLPAIAVTLLSSVAAGSAFAADLIVDEPMMMDHSAASADWGSFYLEVYGGAALPGTSTYGSTDYDMLLGPAVGAAFGMQTPVDGLAVELDVMYSGGIYDGYDYGVYNLSAMGNVEFSVPLNDMFEIYGQAGVGVVNVSYDTDSNWGFGYDLAAGVRAEVVDGVKVFAELKRVGTFGSVEVDGTDISYPTTNALVGLRFAF